MSAHIPSCTAPDCDLAFFAFPELMSLLIVEDGTIVADANTYVDVAFVDAYALSYGFAFVGTQILKEQAILRAMLYIENFEKKFCGKRTSTSQTLAFPRTGLVNQVTGAAVGVNTIPVDLKRAVAEGAIAELVEPEVLTKTLNSSEMNIIQRREKLGPMEREYQYAPNTLIDGQIYRRLQGFLDPFICNGKGKYSVRGH